MPKKSDEVLDGFDVSQRRRYSAISDSCVQSVGVNYGQVELSAYGCRKR